MGFISWIILGLVVGAIVKAIMPGRVRGGWVTRLNRAAGLAGGAAAAAGSGPRVKSAPFWEIAR